MLRGIAAIITFAVVLLILISFINWFDPNRQARFVGTWEMTGKFVTAEPSGSIGNIKTWVFAIETSQQEVDRLNTIYSYGDRSQMGPMKDTGLFHYDRYSKGEWCAELPPSGHNVRIKSPTGYTREVTIRDLDTNRTYRSPCWVPLADQF